MLLYMIGELLGSIGGSTLTALMVILYVNRKYSFQQRHSKLIEEFCDDYFDTAIELEFDEKGEIIE